MQHSDYYYDQSSYHSYNSNQLHQSDLQNPNNNLRSAAASAPPISPSYAASLGFPDYYTSVNPPRPYSDLAPADSSNNASGFQAPVNRSEASHPQYYNYDPHRSGFATDSSGYGQIGGSGMMLNYGTNQDYGGAGGAYDGNYNSQYGNGGVYGYQGGNFETCGAPGGVGKSGSVVFDDYGRPINLSPERGTGGAGGRARTLGDLIKAAPKTGDDDALRIVSSGAQKFRVMLLAEGGGQSNMDVLCQVGLDGIRMLDPMTSRLLRIYPLENVTRWEVLDSDIFAFWSKSSTDFEARRTRLKSNSYTKTIILDAVTASAFQYKEMAPVAKSAESAKVSEQVAEKKKGLVDWMKLVRLKKEEKDYWVPDEVVSKCMACSTDFGAFLRKHHCRNCGDIFCDKCSQGRIALTADEEALPVRVCDRCMAEVTQSNRTDIRDRTNVVRSHEDLIKKLQDEMDKKRQALPGLKAGDTSANVQEVACPTCTVHLKVELPASGSKTIECSVCQHPFLVSAA